MQDELAGTPFAGVPIPPIAALLGWRLLAHDAARGWIRIGFEAKRDFLNPAGVIQGGMLAAMLDDTLGPAVWLKSGGTLFCSTIDLHVSYLAPARPGPLVGEATVLQLGSTIGFMAGQLSDAEGAVLARASASARLVPAPRFSGG